MAVVASEAVETTSPSKAVEEPTSPSKAGGLVDTLRTTVDDAGPDATAAAAPDALGETAELAKPAPEAVETALIELPSDAGPFDSVNALVAAHGAVTGLLCLGSHQAGGEGEAAGLLLVHKLPVLESLPEGLFALTMITSLVLKCNKLSSIAGLESLVSLVSLDISENAFTELQGPSLAQMPQLTELLASENRIVEVPAEIGVLTKLETLALFKNQLKTVSDEIGKCVSLKDVNFFNNVLVKLPAGLAECAALEVLNVGGNKLKTLPSADKWTKLKEFKAHQNGLFVMPSFANMVSLEILKLDFNKALENFPEMGDHPSLEHFELGNCNVTVLPPKMVDWPLKNVYLSANKIKEIPPLAMASLEILNFGNNEVTELPKSLATCTSLKTLFFDKNHITSVPEELAVLAEHALTRINLSAQKTPGIEMTPALRAIKAACEAKKGRFIM